VDAFAQLGERKHAQQMSKTTHSIPRTSYLLPLIPLFTLSMLSVCLYRPAMGTRLKYMHLLMSASLIPDTVSASSVK